MGPIRYVTAAVLCVGVVSGAQATESIWDGLRTPGAVVVLGHSFAPGSQRNLGDSGRAQAKRIGEEFRKHGIAVGVVLSR
ncbi:MAG: hypothetical protein ACREJV_01235 [Candidatus Rokuibacteriota bacterium]